MAMHATAATVPALYVGDLPQDVVDGNLFELFATIGSLASVRVCRDTATGRSLGYGYVNYISEQDAITAIGKLNHAVVCGKPIRIMWSHRDPDARKSGIGNVFVKNLSGSIDNVKLNEMFSKFGTILSCKVVIQDGNSKGYGFVQFDSQDSANAAIENLNGLTVDGKQMYVGNFIKKCDRMLCNPDAQYTNLYIKNLDQDISEELIELKFSEFGKIFNVKIAKDEEGNSNGFGFVNFENPDCAKKAIEAMNGLQLGSKTLYVARAQKKAERQQILRSMFEEKRNEQIRKNMASNVYVKNIDDIVDDKSLRELFRQCGNITSAKVTRDENGVGKGFGFVCYSSSDEAAKAVTSLHGYIFHGKPLYVSIAQRKEERRAQLHLQFAHRMAGLAGSAPAAIPTGYPPVYFRPSGFMPQVRPRQGGIYQSFGMRSGWEQSGSIPPSTPSFQTMPLPTNYMQNGKQGDVNNVSTLLSAPINSHGMEWLSSILSAALPPQQKQILGERLFPLVHKLKADQAAKITGMLLEMDNSELLLLLVSPESLARKVEEAVQVLKLSKTKMVGQEPPLPHKILSTEVAVN
ncbi:hypothetical protein HPP92_019593 [Vanilla planifolia]|uniref:Polyadenylate-binding protein n=1 Tax=Vanilla planifolia TaxID=51239 RepID=A0A835UHQ0_VANPL|nr:hypothetical protein HPP92_019593 [Vanilla planifolia]